MLKSLSQKWSPSFLFEMFSLKGEAFLPQFAQQRALSANGQEDGTNAVGETIIFWLMLFRYNSEQKEVFFSKEVVIEQRV